MRAPTAFLLTPKIPILRFHLLRMRNRTLCIIGLALRGVVSVRSIMIQYNWSMCSLMQLHHQCTTGDNRDEPTQSEIYLYSCLRLHGIKLSLIRYEPSIMRNRVFRCQAYR